MERFVFGMQGGTCPLTDRSKCTDTQYLSCASDSLQCMRQSQWYWYVANGMLVNDNAGTLVLVQKCCLSVLLIIASCLTPLCLLEFRYILHGIGGLA